MRRAAALTLLATASLATATTALVVHRGRRAEPQFCTGGEVVWGPVDYGRLELVPDQPASMRDSCPGHDLWHYSPRWGGDGVLFDDCVIVFFDGRRSTADAEAIPCEPA